MWKLRVAWAVVVIALAFWAFTEPGSEQTAVLPSDSPEALDAEIVRLYQAGKYAEAVPFALKALVLREKALGPEHPDVATTLNDLALLNRAQGRYVEAEPLVKRSLAIREKVLGAEHPDVAAALSTLAGLYQAQGRTADAEPLYKRSLAVYEKALGPDHPKVAFVLENLAGVYRAQGRYPDAEPLYKRGLDIREKALGPEHPDVGRSLNALAVLYRVQGRYGEAEPLYKRGLDIREKALGPKHPDVATSLSNLAELYYAQGRYGEVEPLCKRGLDIREKALGPEHPDVATSLNSLALLYRAQGRLLEAEPLMKRASAIRELALGANHPDVANSLNSLAALYESQGRYIEAEPLYKRGLAIRETTLGLDHADVGNSLSNLAGLYRAEDRIAEAESLYKRAVTVVEKASGRDHPNVTPPLNGLALLYEAQGRYADAEPLYQRILTITENALDPDAPTVATSLNNLASLYLAQGRSADAEPLFKRSLAIREKALGPEHPDVGQALNNLAELYRREGRYGEADPLYKRSLTILEKALGPEHPDVAKSLNSLAWYALARNNLAGAAESWQRATAVLQRRTERGLGDASGRSSNGKAKSNSTYFEGLIKTTHRLKAKGGEEVARRLAEMFSTAQWAQGSEAAAALAQMAARSTGGSPQLAEIVRERQDLVGEWQAKDKLLIAAKSQPTDRRNAADEQEWSDRLAAINAKFAVIDARLAQDFPEYAALVSPKPVSVADIQRYLGDDEALIVFLDTDDRFPNLPEETFVWIVTKTGEPRWMRSSLGTKALEENVAALRCGLDVAAWHDNGAKECGRLLSLSEDAPRPDVNALSFDYDRAHKLYKSLFGEIENTLAGKRLLIVPSGPLQKLPLQVLVTDVPASTGRISWLIRRHAITVLPAVSSLKALRRGKSARTATVGGRKPYIAFANPLLSGQGDRDATGAFVATQKVDCAKVAELRALVAGYEFASLGEQPSTLVDVDWVRKQRPAPYTANLACDVGAALQSSKDDIHLAGRATELNVKSVLGGKTPAPYRIVNFATHGVVAGPLDALREPGLILTPPETGSEANNGYLSASEVAALKLDADWVILAACNTATGGAGNAEALSGLARAFFYAGTRAVLVSHWQVREDAATKLITAAVADPEHAELGRSEAMRRAMLVLADSDDEVEAHPSYWAPFVVVGEGAAGR